MRTLMVLGVLVLGPPAALLADDTTSASPASVASAPGDPAPPQPVGAASPLASETSAPAGQSGTPAPPPADEPPRERVVVMPLQLGHGAALDAAKGDMLVGALGRHLEEAAGWTVLAPQELASLMEQVQRQQATGCDDEACVAELAGALGARRVVSPQLAAAGGLLTFSASVVDTSTASTERRASVRARSFAGLLGQVEELALALAGREHEANLSGPAAAERLGTTEGDLAAFRAWRADHPEQALDEAWTAFIIERNTESTALALAESVLLGGAGVGAALLAWVGMGSLVVLGGLGWAAPLAALSCTALVLAPLTLAMGGAGLVLVVIDALDLGSVKVRREGCCRRTPEILESQRQDGVRKALALTTVLAGPVVMTLAATAVVAAGSGFYVVAASGLGRPVGYPYSSADYFSDPLQNAANNLNFLAFVLTPPVVLCPLLVGTPAGLALLLGPSRTTLLDDDPAAPPGED